MERVDRITFNPTGAVELGTPLAESSAWQPLADVPAVQWVVGMLASQPHLARLLSPAGLTVKDPQAWSAGPPPD